MTAIKQILSPTKKWITWSLYDMADYINGRATKPSEVKDVGIPLIKIAELHNGIKEKTNRLSADTIEPKHRLYDGDLVFAWSASIGIHIYRGPNAALNQHIFRVVARDGINQRFLHYLLIGQMSVFKLFVADKRTTMGHVTIQDLKKTYTQVPPISEQHAIAHILGTLDDKIELNRRMNETLEAIAQAIFRDWFVDFGPTRAKMAGHAPYLASDIWDLFPDKLDKEGNPQGWEIKRLDEIATVTAGRSYTSAELSASDTALVTLKSFKRGGGYRPDGLKPFTGKYNPEQIITPGEIVMSCTDVTQSADIIGRPAIVGKTSLYSRLVASLDLLIIRPKDKICTDEFLYLLCATKRCTNYMLSYTTGTTVLHLTKKAVPAFPLVMPPSDIMRIFAQIGGDIFAKISNLDQESESLATIRDIMLPKLVSGTLKVK